MYYFLRVVSAAAAIEDSGGARQGLHSEATVIVHWFREGDGSKFTYCSKILFPLSKCELLGRDVS